MRISIARIGLVLAVLTGTFWLAPAAQAATITVNTTADELNADGDCSLREAIIAANSDAASDACTPGSGADTITLPAGTYTLSVGPAGDDAALSGDLDIDSNLIITGADARTTIVDGAALDRVFDVDPDGDGDTVAISGVTIKGGDAGSGAGGGVSNQGTLTLDRVTVHGNKANSFGGGISNYIGTLTLTNSTVSDNEGAPQGGGINNFQATASITNSTVSGNLSSGDGGGINSDDAATTLSNVTISKNTADTNGDGGEGGGLQHDGTGSVALRNTIVAANKDGSVGGGTKQNDCGGPVVSGGYNLFADPTGCTGLASTDLVAEIPGLSPLQNNGGSTDTHALKKGSLAIDGGNPAAPGSGGTACEATDQRELPRPGGPRCDIGAFEIVQCLGVDVTIVGTSGADTINGTNKDDAIHALGGDDIVNAGDGKDAVCAGDGDDLVNGEGDNDDIEGQAGNDVIKGQAGNDTTVGRAGNDVIRAGGGNDQARGDAGNDRIKGQAGDDTLKGNKGNDRLNGGKGLDVCKGGAGKDRIRRCEQQGSAGHGSPGGRG